MKAIFVTGTDTGVGKTIVTGLLGWWLRDKGVDVITQKWVQTGCNTDIDEHLRIMGIKKEDIFDYLDSMAPYSLSLPASPHLASSIEGKEIDLERIERSIRILLGRFEYLLIEGTGGILVPLTREHLLIDIVRRLKLSVLVVAGNRLGAINHTLLTIEALKKRGIELIGVVFNNPFRNQDRLIIRDNPKIVNALIPGIVLGSIDFGPIKDLYGVFKPIGERIYKRWMSG